MRVLAIAIVLSLTSGCIATNNYGTARTLEPGEVSHAIGLNGFVVRDAGEVTLMPGALPSYAIRVGVHDRVDLGAQFTAPGNLQIDGKLNPLRTRWFDASIAPSLWLGAFSVKNNERESTFVMGADLPLILDLNLGSSVSVVPSAGPGYLYSPGAGDGGLVVRTGLGVQVRFEGWFLQPAVSSVLDPSRGDFIDLIFGIGVGFGDQPDFGS